MLLFEVYFGSHVLAIPYVSTRTQYNMTIKLINVVTMKVSQIYLA